MGAISLWVLWLADAEEFRGYMKGTAIAYLAWEQDKPVC